MRLDLATWPEIDQRIKRDPGIIIPIGSIEQHGPTGLIGTDALVVEEIARRAGEAGDCLIAPTFPVGLAEHHMGFAGTLSLSLPTFLASIADWIHALARHGFSHLFFLNGHGGNIRGLKLAFASLTPPIPKLMSRNWWDFPAVEAMRREFYGESEGHHATPSEIAITQHVFEAARAAVGDLTPRRAPKGSFRDAEDFRRQFPDGRIGSDPSLATPGQGETLLAAAADALIEEYRAFLEN
jgi:creatinine amidohydrolase